VEICPFNSSACNTLQNSLRFLRRTVVSHNPRFLIIVFYPERPWRFGARSVSEGLVRGFLSLLGHKDQGQERQVGLIQYYKAYLTNIIIHTYISDLYSSTQVLYADISRERKTCDIPTLL